MKLLVKSSDYNINNCFKVIDNEHFLLNFVKFNQMPSLFCNLTHSCLHKLKINLQKVKKSRSQLSGHSFAKIDH
jgi:hypothetical protein